MGAPRDTGGSGTTIFPQLQGVPGPPGLGTRPARQRWKILITYTDNHISKNQQALEATNSGVVFGHLQDFPQAVDTVENITTG